MALLFGFFGPIICWATAGRLNTTWNRYDAAPLMNSNNTSDPFAAWTTLASYACATEQLCLKNASDAARCTAFCLELFSGLDVAAGLSVPATIPEAPTVNGTVVISNATVAVAQPTSSNDETGPWVGVIVCWIFAFVALLGNSTHMSARWAYVSFAATILLFSEPDSRPRARRARIHEQACGRQLMFAALVSRTRRQSSSPRSPSASRVLSSFCGGPPRLAFSSRTAL